MQKITHSLTIRVFEKNEQNTNKIKDCFHEIIPIDFDKEDIKIDHQEVPGLVESPTHTFSLKAHKKRHINMILTYLFSQLPTKDKQMIFNQRFSRLSDKGCFYIRVDKDAFLQGKAVLTEGGDCFHFKIQLAAFPANKEEYIKTLGLFFQKYLPHKTVK